MSPINTKLKICAECIMPEIQDKITFNEKGVCAACQQQKVKRSIDWHDKEKQLIALIDRYRGKYAYDCLIPFSGGEGSTFTAYTLVRKYKVKPLLVSYDHGFLRPCTLQNRVKTIKKLGVDFINFRANWKIVKRAMIESFNRTGDFCWPCHTGVFAYPMQIAVKFKVPLVFWGESTAEYTTSGDYDKPEEINEERFNKFINLGISADDMCEFIGGNVNKRDLNPFRYPELGSLKAIDYYSVCLGSYISWDARKQAEIIREELDWEWDRVEGIPEDYGYQKVECMLYGIRDYLLCIKKGFGRTAHLASIDIRTDKLTRKEGLKLAEQYDARRPASMDWFLDMMEITEGEFMQTALRYVKPPHKFDAGSVQHGEKLWDQDLWDTVK